jgi:hypothetical protein
VLYYRYFLENKLLLYLEDAPHATWGQIWLHNAALPHISRQAMEFWVNIVEMEGRDGVVPWPRQSPDLNPSEATDIRNKLGHRDGSTDWCKCQHAHSLIVGILNMLQ